MQTPGFLAPNWCRSELFGCVTNTSQCNRRAVDCRRPTRESIICAEEIPGNTPEGEKPAKKSKKKKSGKPIPPPKKGLFGRLSNTFLRPLVAVPGGGKDGELFECVFCKGSGVCDCDACRGTGKDALGTCLMCDGKMSLTCTVCSGVGTVDCIRRGGTDDNNDFLTRKQR